MAYKKYTQFIFDDVKNSPRKKELYGDLGDMYEFFLEIVELRYSPTDYRSNRSGPRKPNS
jgi:hypothetical protein